MEGREGGEQDEGIESKLLHQRHVNQGNVPSDSKDDTKQEISVLYPGIFRKSITTEVKESP